MSNEFFMFDGAKNIFPFLPMREDYFYRYQLVTSGNSSYATISLTEDVDKPLCMVIFASSGETYQTYLGVKVTNNLSYDVNVTWISGYIYDETGTFITQRTESSTITSKNTYNSPTHSGGGTNNKFPMCYLFIHKA